MTVQELLKQLNFEEFSAKVGTNDMTTLMRIEDIPKYREVFDRLITVTPDKLQIGNLTNYLGLFALEDHTIQELSFEQIAAMTIDHTDQYINDKWGYRIIEEILFYVTLSGRVFNEEEKIKKINERKILESLIPEHTRIYKMTRFFDGGLFGSIVFDLLFITLIVALIGYAMFMDDYKTLVLLVFTFCFTFIIKKAQERLFLVNQNIHNRKISENTKTYLSHHPEHSGFVSVESVKQSTYQW